MHTASNILGILERYRRARRVTAPMVKAEPHNAQHGTIKIHVTRTRHANFQLGKVNARFEAALNAEFIEFNAVRNAL